MAIIKNPLTLVKQEGGGQTTGDYYARVVDYDGTVLKMEWLNNGDEFTMPEPPTHEGLVFDDWSSSQAITNNKIIIDNNNFIAGPLYHTSSGVHEFDIELTIITGLTIGFRGMPLTGVNVVINWGDGTSDSVSSNSIIHHTYSDYGTYTITYNGAFGDSNNVIIESTWENQRIIRHIRLSNNFYIYQDIYYMLSLGTAYNLETITFPKILDTTKRCSIALYNLYSLNTLILPINSNPTFGNLIGCENLVIPYSCIATQNFRIADTNMNNLSRLKYVVLPSSIDYTNVNSSYAISGCPSSINFIIPSSFAQTPSYGFSSTAVSNKTLKLSSSLTRWLQTTAFNNLYGQIKTIDLSNLDLESSYNYISFTSCKSVEKVILPLTLTSLFGGGFSGCINLREVIFPSTLTELKSGQTFYNCQLATFDFTRCQQIPTLLGTNVFQNTGSTKILVPSTLYAQWITETNWVSLVSRIISVTVS